ncbi:hypothetical protein C458_17635 [Haloferax sp. ATCC BAA-644]|nr:hypothetical protein C460_08690 [Haloferax sp. ATCC BAA-646]ELZ62798.1 hypothetical protein C458_17635 [Haloferax sp. ATCC BAA-644]ELZ64862.1 hypothetical protein C459_10060 [Haloferax sp. ATCC BAA-645]
MVAPPAPATESPAVATISLPAVACCAPNWPHGGYGGCDADEHPDDKMTHDRRRGHDRQPAPDGPEGREQ